MSRERGFGLLELLVATSILMLGALLATELIVESHLESQRRTAELQNPQPGWALARLRFDIEGAASITGLLPGWREEGLHLVDAAGRHVVWQQSGVHLERLELDEGSEVVLRQVLLEGLDAWRWQRVSRAVVDVNLRYLERIAVGPVNVGGSARDWAAETRSRDVFLRLARRRTEVEAF